MQIKTIPGSKYNPHVGVGFVDYADLEYQHAMILALIVDDCFNNIADPFFATLKKNHKELSECALPSVSDFGALLATSVSKEEGMKIYLDLPYFSKPEFNSVRLAAAFFLNRSCWEFVKRYNNDQSWIFPITFMSADSLELDFNCEVEGFNSNWLTSEGLGALRYMNISRPGLRISEDLTLNKLIASAGQNEMKKTALNILSL